MLDAPPIQRTMTSPEGTAAGISALLTHAAFAPLDDLGFLRVTGDDRVRWLNGMATNSIQTLGTGGGCYNFFLNAQGRIQGDATVFALEDSILLETARARISAILAMLDHYIIMDDVELTPMDAYAGLLVAGPFAAAFLHSLSLPAAELPELHLIRASFEGAPVDLIHANSPLVPRFELWAAPGTIAAITTALAARLPQATPETLEGLRLLEGIPLYGIDIRDRDLPQETALPGAPSRALHFSKGCYLGQEIVERIRSRGNVHRTLSGFVLTGPVPPAGTAFFNPIAPQKSLGELTSAAFIELPSGPITVALGFIRREALDASRSNPGQIHFAGGLATPISLPYELSPPA